MFDIYNEMIGFVIDKSFYFEVYVENLIFEFNNAKFEYEKDFCV